ncbi:hypothetical protein niasHS_011426 [Heterodera schachtii]|uniref:Gland protein n=1 Tax=Heterodera schachtii TaxID=97005 RepID=A0ABD2ILK7_HETSC
MTTELGAARLIVIVANADHRLLLTTWTACTNCIGSDRNKLALKSFVCSPRWRWPLNGSMVVLLLLLQLLHLFGCANVVNIIYSAAPAFVPTG